MAFSVLPSCFLSLWFWSAKIHWPVITSRRLKLQTRQDEELEQIMQLTGSADEFKVAEEMTRDDEATVENYFLDLPLDGHVLEPRYYRNKTVTGKRYFEREKVERSRDIREDKQNDYSSLCKHGGSSSHHSALDIEIQKVEDSNLSSTSRREGEEIEIARGRQTMMAVTTGETHTSEEEILTGRSTLQDEKDIYSEPVSADSNDLRKVGGSSGYSQHHFPEVLVDQLTLEEGPAGEKNEEDQSWKEMLNNTPNSEGPGCSVGGFTTDGDMIRERVHAGQEPEGCRISTGDQMGTRKRNSECPPELINAEESDQRDHLPEDHSFQKQILAIDENCRRAIQPQFTTAQVSTDLGREGPELGAVDSGPEDQQKEASEFSHPYFQQGRKESFHFLDQHVQGAKEFQETPRTESQKLLKVAQGREVSKGGQSELKFSGTSSERSYRENSGCTEPHYPDHIIQQVNLEESFSLVQCEEARSLQEMLEAAEGSPLQNFVVEQIVGNQSLKEMLETTFTREGQDFVDKCVSRKAEVREDLRFKGRLQDLYLSCSERRDMSTGISRRDLQQVIMKQSDLEEGYLFAESIEDQASKEMQETPFGSEGQDFLDVIMTSEDDTKEETGNELGQAEVNGAGSDAQGPSERRNDGLSQAFSQHVSLEQRDVEPSHPSVDDYGVSLTDGNRSIKGFSSIHC